MNGVGDTMLLWGTPLLENGGVQGSFLCVCLLFCCCESCREGEYGMCRFMILCFSPLCQTLSKALLMFRRMMFVLFFAGELSAISPWARAIALSVRSEPVSRLYLVTWGSDLFGLGMNESVWVVFLDNEGKSPVATEGVEGLFCCLAQVFLVCCIISSTSFDVIC